MTDDQCVFCEIFAEEKGKILLETKHFFVIEDKYPATRGHCLIISKKHHQELSTLSRHECADFLNTLWKTSRMLKKKFRHDGCNIGVNCGEAAGQTVPHLHIHFIPRYARNHNAKHRKIRGGVRSFSPPPKQYEN